MLATSPDGQWAIVQRGREVRCLANGAGPPVASLELEDEDVDLAFAGPPTLLVAVGRSPSGARITLHQPPSLEMVARLDLERPMKLAAITGPRVVLVSLDGKAVQIVRVAARSLASTPIDVGSPVEFSVGLDRNQVLFGLLRKLEVWDAVSARPLARLQLQLPPPPRTVGAAHGHLWVTRPGSDEVFIYRLSDGRPFRHYVGAPVESVVCHPNTPLIVLVTARGLVRLHCTAHSLTVVDAPWAPGTALAQLVTGDELGLVGVPEGGTEPWRVSLGGPPPAASPMTGTSATSVLGAPLVAKPTSATDPADAAGDTPVTVETRLRSLRARAVPASDPDARPAPDADGTSDVDVRPPPDPQPPHVVPGRHTEADGPTRDVFVRSAVDAAPPTTTPTLNLASPSPTAVRVAAPAWREPLAAWGLELVRGGGRELPPLPDDTELTDLAHRLALSDTARRALTALYGLYLVGEPAIAIARLAHVLADWTEALGGGELGALAMLRRKGGKVALRATVTELLDGAAPRAIRLVGGAPATTRPGVTQLARAGASSAAIVATLATRLGQIGVLEGSAARGVLEARLVGVTAVALVAPPALPAPWPRDAGLIVVVDADAPSWVAALPATAS